MRTIDEQFSPGSSLWRRLRRDVRLVFRLGRMLFAYFTTGRKLRRAYRDKESRGETIWLDGEHKP